VTGVLYVTGSRIGGAFVAQGVLSLTRSRVSGPVVSSTGGTLRAEGNRFESAGNTVRDYSINTLIVDNHFHSSPAGAIAFDGANMRYGHNDYPVVVRATASRMHGSSASVTSVVRTERRRRSSSRATASSTRRARASCSRTPPPTLRCVATTSFGRAVPPSTHRLPPTVAATGRTRPARRQPA